ncbi:MAG: CpsD/CapB family tyrosine-protein kinase [Clostridia bacterium]|nr:CpsD/CapB family tyrosine-protein kinase [Clostridia bacterium]
MSILGNLKKKKNAGPTDREGTIGKDLDFSASEAYKRLRTNLLFSFSGDEACHVIGITSSLRGEGKSTTSMNLAYTLAEAGKRVLLIDADMRLPQAHAILKIHQTPGLSNVLVGENNGANLIQPSGIQQNLHIITAGDISPNPTELLGSRRLVGMLDSLKPRYDYIVIDLPPVGAVADALIVSKLTSGMVVVVRQNYVEKAVLENTITQLRYHKANILGFVENYAEGEGGYYQKRYYKKDGYYYYRKEDKEDKRDGKESES